MDKIKAKQMVQVLSGVFSDTPALKYSTPYELLVAVILSAQCTDERVNKVTEKLFKEYNTPQKMLTLSQEKLQEYIFSCGFYRNKAKHILSASKDIIDKFNSEVPNNLEALRTLAGVGRKTANLLLGDLYGVPGSVVCDTHCIRICGRLGLSVGKEPEKVERQLRAILPPEESSDFCHRIVLFGRDCCTAQRPKCGECPLTVYCREFNPNV